MRQAQKKKEKDKVAIVLMLAFCVIALTSIFTVKSNIDKINEDAGDILVSEDTKSDETENRVEAEKPDASAEVDVRVPVVAWRLSAPERRLQGPCAVGLRLSRPGSCPGFSALWPPPPRRRR